MHAHLDMQRPRRANLHSVWLLAALLAGGQAAAAHLAAKTPSPAPVPADSASARAVNTGIETGSASWYGEEFAGRPTASGEIYDPTALTAAHTSLPFGSFVEITNLENGRSALVRINDRGPFCKGRILDCSHAVARALGFLRQGLANVRVRRVDPLAGPLGALHPVAPVQVVAAGGTATSPAARAAANTALANREDAAPPVPLRYAAADLRCSSYCVQLGSYQESDNARDMLQKAAMLDVPAFLHHSQRLLQVLVGPYADRSRAEEIRARLSAAGLNCFVRLLH